MTSKRFFLEKPTPPLPHSSFTELVIAQHNTQNHIARLYPQLNYYISVFCLSVLVLVVFFP